MLIPYTLTGQPIIIDEHVMREEHDSLSTRQKVSAYAQSFFREARYGFNNLWYRNLGSPYQFHQPDEQIAWKEKSEGLYVFVHGLNGHPSIWNSHLSELEEHANIDTFVPYVPHGGKCTLEEAAHPLLPNILDYIQKHPDRPICLIGVSNGSRIVTWLETELREQAKGTAIKVSTIAGVHFGTTVVNQLEEYGVASYLLSPAVREELQYGSQKATTLLKKIVKECHTDKIRSYDFFAATEDLYVPCLNSSLPRLDLGEKHYVVHGYGHNSIVSGVCEQQMQICKEWMSIQMAKKSKSG
jgi:hypothetical protein